MFHVFEVLLDFGCAMTICVDRDSFKHVLKEITSDFSAANVSQSKSTCQAIAVYIAFVDTWNASYLKHTNRTVSIELITNRSVLRFDLEPTSRFSQLWEKDSVDIPLTIVHRDLAIVKRAQSLIAIQLADVGPKDSWVVLSQEGLFLFISDKLRDLLIC